jgi:UDP-N-acetylglucosamine 4,6-dehydratase
VHDVLVSEDEARHTVEVDGMFVINPNHPWWGKDNWLHGKPLAEGYRYTSDTNPQWCTTEELKALLHEGGSEAVETVRSSGAAK